MDKPLTRTARLLDLIPFILSHQGIATSELASEFQVTENEILADLTLIFMCGLPQYTALELIDLSFENGFVTCREPQNLNKPRKLNNEELSILIMGLTALEHQVSDPQKLQSIISLQSKLRNLVNDIPVEQFVFSENRNLSFLDVIHQALKRRMALQITYLNTTKDQISKRLVTPIEIFQQGDEVLLLTWCHLSKANRTFAIMRIQECEIVEATPDGLNPIEPNGKNAENDQMVITFQYNRSALSFIENVKEQLLNIDEKLMVATIKVWDSEWLLRNVMANRGNISIIEPESFANEIVARAKLALSNY